jgi:hypothetical protein
VFGIGQVQRQRPPGARVPSGTERRRGQVNQDLVPVRGDTARHRDRRFAVSGLKPGDQRQRSGVRGGRPIASSNVPVGEDRRRGRPIRAITRSVRSRRRVCAVPSQKRATLHRIHPTPPVALGTAGTVNAGSKSTSLAAISMTSSSALSTSTVIESSLLANRQRDIAE